MPRYNYYEITPVNKQVAVMPVISYWSMAVMESTTPYMCILISLLFDTAEELSEVHKEILNCFKTGELCVFSPMPEVKSRIMACRLSNDDDKELFLWVKDNVQQIILPMPKDSYLE